MPTQLSLPLIAALLLSNFVIAQAIGLRAPKNLDEAIGLGISTTLTLIATAIIDWPIAHFILQPLELNFLHNLITVLIIATSAHIVEFILHGKYPRFFPLHGNLLPQIIVNTLILMLPLTGTINEDGFTTHLIRALLLGLAATGLLTLFQALREHSATADLPLPLRGAAIDMISAGLLIAACSGLAGVF